MRWSEPQQSMLQAMGLRLWQPGAAGEAVSEAAVLAPKPAQAPVRRAAAEPAPVLDSARRTADLAAAPATPQPPTHAATPTPTKQPVAAPSAPADERSQAIAAMDWPALRQAVATCQACGLCSGRQQTVFGTGHERADWMIVGEAPGEQEDLQGEPFVGAAGRLLDRMLLALKLTREVSDSRHQVYIANTLKCRPPRNRNPEPAELAQCLPFLERQVALIQPKLILAMGRFAVQSLLSSTEAIGKLRGRLHTWRGVPVVVTYHPAYLLRQPGEKGKAWDDLCLAADAMDRARTP
jgi:uracil-DNA glycosylase